jgi:hypothetical protein
MKKFIAISFMVLILLFFAGCAEVELDSEYEERIAQYEKDATSAEKTKETLDINVCNEIPDLDIRDNCYRDVAVATNNTSICEIMYRQAPKDSCYLTIGKATKDINLCNKIKTLSMQEECISEAK